MNTFTVSNPKHARAARPAPRITVAALGGIIAAGCTLEVSNPDRDSAGVAGSELTLDPSTTYSLSGIGSGKCIQPRGGSTASGTVSVIESCTGGAAQRYVITAAATSGAFTVRNVSSNNCLAIQGASSQSGALITQEACTGATHQQWSFRDLSGGVVALTAQSSGLSLDVTAGGTANGTAIQQWGFGNQANQQFRLIDARGGGAPSPNVFASAAGQVDVFVNGASLGRSSGPGAMFSVGAALATGAENIIVLRATKGSAAVGYVHAEIDGAFGKAGSSALWKAKLAVGSEATDAAGPWTALGFDDSAWPTAADVGVAPKAGFPVNGPAAGMWSRTASDSTVLFRLKLYIPAGISASTPQGFGRGVTGGAGGAVVTVTTPAGLLAAITDNTPRIVQVSGTIDFTGTEGPTTESSCFQSQCSDGTFEYITNGLGACTSAGKPTFNVTFDKAGKLPMSVGSNKTIIGIGRNATIRGKGLRMVGGVSNIAIRNLTITNINPQIVWGGDALAIDNADRIWIDHVRVSLIGRQFFVTGFGRASNVTLSWNELDGRTPFSATCNGSHYWLMLNAGDGDTITMSNNWIHNTSGRGPHAGNVAMQFINDFYDTVPGHAADPSADSALLYEGTYFRNVITAIGGDTGGAFAPLGANVASTNAACQGALRRSCTANFASPQPATFPLAQNVLTRLGTAGSAVLTAYPATEVPNVVPHLAGPGHL